MATTKHLNEMERRLLDVEMKCDMGTQKAENENLKQEIRLKLVRQDRMD